MTVIIVLNAVVLRYTPGLDRTDGQADRQHRRNVHDGSSLTCGQTNVNQRSLTDAISTLHNGSVAATQDNARQPRVVACV